MELNSLRSAELPDLSPSVKELVNDGRWTLFRAASPHLNPQVAYCVVGGLNLYRLDSTGNVLSIGAAQEAPPVEERLYFEDVRQPRSISEDRFAARRAPTGAATGA
jgi:hypothetical protein